MAKAKKTKESTEEYKFQPEEYSGDYGTEAEAESESATTKPKMKMPRFRLPQNKKFLVVLLLIVVLFVVYEFIKPKKTVEQQIAQTATTATVSTATIPTVSIEQSTLAQRITGNTNTISQLQNKLTETQTTLNSMKESLNTVNASIQLIVGEMGKIQAELKKKPVTKIKLPEITYHVRALIPGRAWLESSRGALVTVRLGNKISGYGKITKINWRNGTVKTSSGLLIRYGVNDI